MKVNNQGSGNKWSLEKKEVTYELMRYFHHVELTEDKAIRTAKSCCEYIMVGVHNAKQP